MAARVSLLLLVLLVSWSKIGCQECGHDSVTVNNWPDDKTGVMRNITIEHATAISCTGTDTADHFDASKYVTVTLVNPATGVIQFSAKPSLTGILDFPDPSTKTSLSASCEVKCGSKAGSFSFTAYMKDANTASPAFSASSYSLEVVENYPLNLPLLMSNFTATDADPDLNNNKLKFRLIDKDDTFSLTAAQHARDGPATYTAQLKLKRQLDFAVKKTYRFTIVAEDPFLLKATSDVTVDVKDVDNDQPRFQYSSYSAQALNKTVVGPLNVQPGSISASDPDAGGPFQYSLTDVQGHWTDYFAIEPSSGELRLDKEIPDSVSTPPQVAFVLQAKQAGSRYSCQTTLLIQLVPSQGDGGGGGSSSDVGYIVGIGVLGGLLVAVVAVAIINDRRHRKHRQRIGDTATELARGEQGPPAGGRPAQLTTPERDGEAFRGDQMADYAAFSPPSYGYGTGKSELGQMSAPYQNLIGEEAPHCSSANLYPALPRDATPPPMAEPIGRQMTTAPPIAEAVALPSDEHPPITAAASPPGEPAPDYSLKSVGFKDTVVCVILPEVEEPDRKEAGDDDDADGQDEEVTSLEVGSDDEADGEDLPLEETSHGNGVTQGLDKEAEDEAGAADVHGADAENASENDDHADEEGPGVEETSHENDVAQHQGSADEDGAEGAHEADADSASKRIHEEPGESYDDISDKL